MRILFRNFSFAVNVDKQNFSIKVDQTKPRFVKFELSSLYFQMRIVSKNLSMEMDRSKQKNLEILTLTDSLFVITLNVDLTEQFPY